MIGYPQIEPCTEYATRVLAPNPGPMTLDGTNTYVLRRPDSHRIVVVDPGPRESTHLRRILTLGEVELILLTHGHHDHSESAGVLSRLTGAPVRAADPAFSANAGPLADGEQLNAGGLRLSAIATPGQRRIRSHFTSMPTAISQTRPFARRSSPVTRFSVGEQSSSRLPMARSRTTSRPLIVWPRSATRRFCPVTGAPITISRQWRPCIGCTVSSGWERSRLPSAG